MCSRQKKLHLLMQFKSVNTVWKTETETDPSYRSIDAWIDLQKEYVVVVVSIYFGIDPPTPRRLCYKIKQ